MTRERPEDRDESFEVLIVVKVRSDFGCSIPDTRSKMFTPLTQFLDTY